MDADEWAQRSRDLWFLGWEHGAGAAIWARAITDELARHEEARARYSDEATRYREAYEQVYSSALLLVVAVEQVLAFEQRVRRITGDAELAAARRRFDMRFPHAEAIRDIAAHLDAYAVGEGDRQTGRGRQAQQQEPVTERNVSQFISWSDGGGTVLQLAEEVVNLRAAASAAVVLAEVVERRREKYFHRAEAEADAASRREWGFDPPPQ